MTRTQKVWLTGGSIVTLIAGISFTVCLVPGIGLVLLGIVGLALLACIAWAIGDDIVDE